MAAGIQTYSLPECDDDEDVEYKQQCALLKVCYSSTCLGILVAHCICSLAEMFCELYIVLLNGLMMIRIVEDREDV